MLRVRVQRAGFPPKAVSHPVTRVLAGRARELAAMAVAVSGKAPRSRSASLPLLRDDGSARQAVGGDIEAFGRRGATHLIDKPAEAAPHRMPRHDDKPMMSGRISSRFPVPISGLHHTGLHTAVVNQELVILGD
jgi:hypothetical protein